MNHVWGTAGHNGQHATEIFPEAMRWLWKDWPAPVKAGLGSRQLQDILIPGEDWKLVAKGYRFTEGPAVNATDLPTIVDDVVPILQRAGRFRAGYRDGETLRERLGLPVAPNRYTAVHQ